MKELELENIILQMQAGNATAFEKIYDAYSASLFGIALKILKDQELAEDVLQDAFVKIWSKVNSFDVKKGSFFTWMLNITRNTAIDKYRQVIKKSGITIQTHENTVSNNEAHSSSIPINHIGVKDLLQTLPTEQQEIIEYLYFKGYTQQEVSDELNIPLGTVKTRSRSALKALKDIFIILVTWI